MTTIERPRTQDVPLRRLHDARLRAWCGLLLGAVLIQVLLGAANVSWLRVPESGDATTGVSPRWLLEAHAWFGTALVVAALVLLVLAIRSHDRTWILLAAIGLVGLVVALASGDQYVRSHGHEEWASMAMACGAVITLAAYAVGASRRRS